MYNEKGLAQEQTAQAIATDRQKAFVLCHDACRTLSGKRTPPGKMPGNADDGRRKSGNFMASIMSYTKRKSEVEQGIEEQRLDMEKEKLKICKRKAGFRSRAEKTRAGFIAEGKRSKGQG